MSTEVTSIVKGRTVQEEADLPFDFYQSDAYFSKEQLSSFMEQISILHNLKPKTLLEIGKGNGVVSEILKISGIDITTMDINAELKPDIIGDINELDSLVEENQFESILCAEVLEHIPFEKLDTCLYNFSKIASKNVVITIPRSRKTLFDFKFSFQNHVIREKRFRLYSSYKRSSKSHTDIHHWELYSEKRTTLSAIKKMMSKYFVVEDEGVCDLPYHHYFVLRVK